MPCEAWEECQGCEAWEDHIPEGAVRVCEACGKVIVVVDCEKCVWCGESINETH